MLQSVPAQVVSQVHEASLLQTCTVQTEMDGRENSVIRSADTLRLFL